MYPFELAVRSEVGGEIGASSSQEDQTREPENGVEGGRGVHLLLTEMKLFAGHYATFKRTLKMI